MNNSQIRKASDEQRLGHRFLTDKQAFQAEATVDNDCI